LFAAIIQQELRTITVWEVL